VQKCGGKEVGKTGQGVEMTGDPRRGGRRPLVVVYRVVTNGLPSRVPAAVTCQAAALFFILFFKKNCDFFIFIFLGPCM
jgi:hypothetical protein